MIKSLSALYFQQIVSCGRAKIIRDIKSGHNAKQKQNFRTGMKKHKNTDSGLVQQLSLSVPTAREDLAPQVQAGCGRGEHDQVLLLQAKAAHARGWAVVARPGEDLLKHS